MIRMKRIAPAALLARSTLFLAMGEGSPASRLYGSGDLPELVHGARAMAHQGVEHPARDGRADADATPRGRGRVGGGEEGGVGVARAVDQPAGAVGLPAFEEYRG